MSPTPGRWPTRATATPGPLSPRSSPAPRPLSPAQSAPVRVGPAPPLAGVLLVSDQEDGVSEPLYFDDYYADAVDDIFGHPYYYNILYHTRDVRVEDLTGPGAGVWYP